MARDICLRIAGRFMDVQDSRTLNLGITLTEVVNPSDLTDLQVILVCIITGHQETFKVLVYLDIYGQVIISLMLVDKCIYSIVCLKS